MALGIAPTPAQEAAHRDGIVVVGAGQAGGRAVEALRASGFKGALTLVGKETYFPYERPSLSKEMLLNTDSETIAWVHSPGYFEQHGIKFHAGCSAVRIDRDARCVVLSDGQKIAYGTLLLTTGRRVRRLAVPGADLPGCLYLRDLNDSRALRARLKPGLQLLVLGAGFIGLEVAAAAIKRGCKVKVLEAADAPIARAASPAVGIALRKLHEEHGVQFHFNIQPVQLRKRGETIIVSASTGEDFEADLVVIGVGAEPNSELAAEAGLAVDGGIVTDAFGATNDPFIFAAGDVARQYSTLFQRHLVLESWQNAQNAAIAVARNLARAGAMTPHIEVPWFWSDQYGKNLQIYGLLHPEGEEVTRHRANASDLYFQMYQGRLVFAAGFGATRELRPARDLIASGAEVSAAELADAGLPIGDILRRLKTRQVA